MDITMLLYNFTSTALTGVVGHLLELLVGFFCKTSKDVVCQVLETTRAGSTTYGRALLGLFCWCFSEGESCPWVCVASKLISSSLVLNVSSARQKYVRRAWEKADINTKWAATRWAKKIEAREKVMTYRHLNSDLFCRGGRWYEREFCVLFFLQKAKMTDFDRYRVMKAKKMVSFYNEYKIMF